MIVLGSHPIQGIVGREGKDIDVLATLDEFREYVGIDPSVSDRDHVYAKKGERIYDCELIWDEGTGLELARLILSHPETKFDQTLQAWTPNLNILYMLKMTHRYKKNSPHFHKTMRDIRVMRACGAEIEPQHMEFYKRRKKATLHYEHPNLNRTKEEFFNPEDDYMVYDHDSIHETVALYDGPAYQKYAVEGTEVLSSKQKFYEQTHAVRLAGVYEETAVLALERHQIPNNFTPNYLHSAQLALEKVCTSITSGWFREFAWEHYDEVLKMFSLLPNYVENFKKNEHLLTMYHPTPVVTMRKSA